MKKKIKIILIITTIIVLAMIGVVIFLIIKNNINKTKILNIDNEKYFLQYDNTWEVSKQEEKEIDLIHKKTESKLNIKMVELEEDDQYKELDQIFDSFLYNIQNQNKDYKLIYKENTTFTKNNINGYKILFEGEGKQFLISLYRQGNTLACFTYEASNNYFDIVLDSVNTIINNFEIKEIKFDVFSDINIETEPIDYTDQPNIVEMLKEDREEVVEMDENLGRKKTFKYRS